MYQKKTILSTSTAWLSGFVLHVVISNQLYFVIFCKKCRSKGGFLLLIQNDCIKSIQDLIWLLQTQNPFNLSQICLEEKLKPSTLKSNLNAYVLTSPICSLILKHMRDVRYWEFNNIHPCQITNIDQTALPSRDWRRNPLFLHVPTPNLITEHWNMSVII